MSDKEDKGGLGILILLLGFLVFVGFLVSSATVDTNYVTNEDITTILYQHDKIHEGDSYFYKNYDTLSNLDENKTFFFNVSDKRVHLIFEYGNSDETAYYFYENCTAIDEGIELTTFNRNRKFGNHATMDLHKNASVDLTYATLIYAADHVTKKYNPGVLRDRNELVLKNNTGYCFIFIDKVNADDVVNYVFDWYEVKPR